MNIPKAYKGSEPYIFVSYSHRDSETVMEIIQNMIDAGYRIWYDEGIDPGTAWDENIANHIETAGFFLAFVSPGYVGSDNCRDELNFSRDLKMPQLMVYLAETKLTPGMKMRMGRVQAIFKYATPRIEDFYNKLFEAKELWPYREDGACPVITSSDEEDDSESTVFLSYEETDILDDDAVSGAFLKRLSTGENIVLSNGEFKIGKDVTKVDYAIAGNKTISRLHAIITFSNEGYYIEDAGSTNHTYVNGEMKVEGQKVLLQDGDIIRLSNEEFGYFEGVCEGSDETSML